jgi:hypothetical protein
MKRLGRTAVCFVITYFIIYFFVFLGTGAAAERRQVIFVVCDKLELDDVNSSEYPYLHKFFGEGATALLNTTTAGRSRTRSHAVVSISSGCKATGTSAEPLVFGVDEEYQGQPAGVVFAGRTGIYPSPGSIVVLDQPLLQYLQKEVGVTARPGLLGEALHEKGLKTAVLGNADLPGSYYRASAVIAMDCQGIVDRGEVSAAVFQVDSSGRLGYRTNYGKLKEKFLEVAATSDFIVIDLGDLARLDRQRTLLAPQVYFQEKKRLLGEIDDFLGWLLSNVNLQKSWILVASLSPTTESLNQKNYFTVIGVLGEGMEKGLLVTPTTRRAGLVTLYDIAPSILDYLGVDIPKEMVGRPWRVQPFEDPLGFIKKVEAKAVFTSQNRSSVIKGYVVLHLLVLASLLWFLWFDLKKKELFYPLLLGLMAGPLVFLIMAAFPPPGLWAYLLSSLALVAGLIWLATLLARNKELDPLLILCLATVGVIIGDTFLGNPLQKYSILGYDAMSGARFYGIGNEYMGVLLGATLMGASIFTQRSNSSSLTKIMIGVFFLVVTTVLAAPQWGSNFGGTIAALASFIYTFFRLSGGRFSGFSKGRLLGILLLTLVFAGGLLFWDYSRPPELRSHFGQLIASVKAMGWTALVDVVSRKVGMNLYLIRYTIWTKVFLGTLVALALLFSNPVGILRQVVSSFPAVAAGLEGSIVAAFVALLANDSGIVAAATTIIFPSVTLFFLVLRKQLK